MKMNELNSEEKALFEQHRNAHERQEKLNRFSDELDTILIQWLKLGCPKRHFAEIVYMFKTNVLTLSDEFLEDDNFINKASEFLSDIDDLIKKEKYRIKNRI